MTTKKDDDSGQQDATGAGGNADTDTDTDDGDDNDDGEEAGWTRMQEMIDASVGKALGEWSAKQKTTSSSLPRKPVKKTAPKRKQGFLSTQFFSNLNPDE